MTNHRSNGIPPTAGEKCRANASWFAFLDDPIYRCAVFERTVDYGSFILPCKKVRFTKSRIFRAVNFNEF
ncbi:MAG: hypothetical protein GY820_01805 [Gammaproteobacteria bacterium]|nr:hypothetical protein [Gammaproteobacteria bacterium]